MDDIKRIDLVDIELNSGTLYRSWAPHSIGTADALANAFGVRVFRDGETVNLEGGSVQGYFRDPQGNNIAITSSSYRHISGNEAYIILPQACYNYEGQFTLAIKLINNGAGITGTMRIVDGMVDNTNTGSAVAPTGEVPTYEEVLSVYEEMLEAKAGSVRFDITQSLTAAQKLQAKENIEAAGKSMIAPEYSATGRYAVGDYCLHGGNLYRCKKAITADTAWNESTYWTQCTAAGQVKSVLENVAPAWEANHAYQVGDYVSYNRDYYRMTVQPTNPDTAWTAGHWTKVDIANDLKARLNTVDSKIENKITVSQISGDQYKLVIA